MSSSPYWGVPDSEVTSSLHDAILLSPCVIELGNECDGVKFESDFILYRTYEELIVSRAPGEGYAGISVVPSMQSLKQSGNRYFDRVEYTVTAWSETDWEMLKQDWESHNEFLEDPQGMSRHLELRQSRMVTYKTTGYFDITRFFRKQKD